MKYIKELLPYIIVILIVFLIRQFIVSPIQVVGESMVPNLEDKELMLLNKMTYRFNDIKRFDIVVVNQDGKKPIIKRIIGLPGEKIEFRNNKLYINDEEVKQNFKTNGDTEDFELSSINYTTIPKGYYFVVGDNRINSVDSRMIGLISKDEIEGKASFVLFPLSKFGNI